MIIFFLILTDILIPILMGCLIVSTFYGLYPTIEYLEAFIFYGLLVIFSSFLLNYYKNYFATNFSEKIKISIITSFIAIFFQLIYFINMNTNMGIWIIIYWTTVPGVILIIRYSIKKKYNNINEISIYIIGNQYQFNKYELDMLAEKGFKLYFYQSDENFYKKFIYTLDKDNSIIVLNSDLENIKRFNHDNHNIISFNTISLNDFLVKYLRKINLDDQRITIDLKPYSRLNFFIKRSIDYLFITISSLILLITIIFIGIIKHKNNISDSLIYSQKRYGKNRRLFLLYKIRTMHINSDTKGVTEKNDVRVYPFARFIRECRLDEFSQILNIFLGHMHLVGPRAEWIKLSDEYYKNIPNYNLRHIVMPGITGWAQIVYPYGQNEADAKQKLMYDLYYIKNWSIWLEIEICIKTFFIMLDKRGF